MPSKIEELKRRIFAKKESGDFLSIYHYLMTAYGWIPFEEFKKLPAEIVTELIKRINKDAKEASKAGKLPHLRRK